LQKLSSIQTSAEINAIKYNTSALFELAGESNVHQFNALQMPLISKCHQNRRKRWLAALLLVSGRADDFEYRDTIRKTWAQPSFIGSDLRVVFIMGRSDDIRANALIKEEAQTHRDILQEHFDDSFNTKKLISGLKWASEHCQNVHFIVKVNVNTVVNSVVLVKYLESVKKETSRLKNVMLGDLKTDIRVNRDTDYMDFISEAEFKEPVYYPFCQSSAFVLTSSLAASIYNLSRFVNWPPFSTVYDDVYVGTLAVSLESNLVQLSSFFQSHPIPLIKPSAEILFVRFNLAYEANRVWKELNPNNSRAIDSSPNPFDVNKPASICKEISKTKSGLIEYNFKNFLITKPVYRRNYTFILNPTISQCSSADKQLLLLAMVMVGPDRFDRRKEIRNTWANTTLFGNDDFKVVFVVGLSRNKTVNAMIRREHEFYKDILQIDFDDSYYGLTTKVITSLKWSSNSCKNAHFVFRVNDDIAVNTVMLIEYLKTVSDRNLDKIVFGNLLVYQSPIRDRNHKFYVSHEEYSHYLYYPYFEGLSCFIFKSIHLSNLLIVFYSSL
jgi:hypothetical protein